MARERKNSSKRAKKVYIQEQVSLSGFLLTNGENMVKKTIFDMSTSTFIEDDENGKYSISLIVNKHSDSGKKLEKTFNKVLDIADAHAKTFYDIPLIGDRKSKSFIKDGDDESEFTTYYDFYKDSWIITAKTDKDFIIKDIEGYRLKMDEVDNDEFYAGSICTMAISIYYSETVTGMFASINGIKKNREGEHFFNGFELDDDALEMSEADEEFFDNYDDEYEGE
jgi:hypothetical protein